MYFMLQLSLYLTPAVARRSYWPNVGHGSKRQGNTALHNALKLRAFPSNTAIAGTVIAIGSSAIMRVHPLVDLNGTRSVCLCILVGGQDYLLDGDLVG